MRLRKLRFASLLGSAINLAPGVLVWRASKPPILRYLLIHRETYSAADTAGGRWYDKTRGPCAKSFILTGESTRRILRAQT